MLFGRSFPAMVVVPSFALICRGLWSRHWSSSRSVESLGPDLLRLDRTAKLSRVFDEYPSEEILFGIHPISAAVTAQRRVIKAVYYRRDIADTNQRVKDVLQSCWSKGIETKMLHRTKMEEMAPRGKPHQGFLARVSHLQFLPLPLTMEAVRDLCGKKKAAKSQVWLLLYEVQDPMNFGAVLRIAYFLGVDQIFVTGRNRYL